MDRLTALERLAALAAEAYTSNEWAEAALWSHTRTILHSGDKTWTEDELAAMVADAEQN